MNDTKISPPCYKCGERYQGCHAKCAYYLAFCEELQAAKEKKRKYADVVDFQIRNIYKGRRDKERKER